MSFFFWHTRQDSGLRPRRAPVLTALTVHRTVIHSRSLRILPLSYCQKKKHTCRCAFSFGAPGRIRTCDLPVRSRALYPLSYKRIFAVLEYYTTRFCACQALFYFFFAIFILSFSTTQLRSQSIFP